MPFSSLIFLAPSPPRLTRRSRLDHLDGVRDKLRMIEPGVASVETLRGAFEKGKINLIDCDLLDPFSVNKLIAAVNEVNRSLK